MNSERVKVIFKYIYRLLKDKNFNLSGSELLNNSIIKFIKIFEDENGFLNESILIDYIIFSIYRLKDVKFVNQPTYFSKNSIEKFLSRNRGVDYYTSQFVEDNGTTRGTIKSYFINNSKHPLSKYIYVESEELTKMRKINTLTGYFICINNTTLYSPHSEACLICSNSDRCESNLINTNPELHRLRVQNTK